MVNGLILTYVIHMVLLFSIYNEPSQKHDFTLLECLTNSRMLIIFELCKGAETFELANNDNMDANNLNLGPFRVTLGSRYTETLSQLSKIQHRCLIFVQK